MKYLTTSEKDTIKLGERCAKKLKGGEVFLLTGELGGGKTQFVKGLAQGLGIGENITSPTFTYEKIYKGKDLTLYHFDLYREAVLDFDVQSLISEAAADKKGIVAIEWSERAKKMKFENSKKFVFKWKGENEREITES